MQNCILIYEVKHFLLDTIFLIEILKRRKIQYRVVQSVGCLAYYKNNDPKRIKLGPRGIMCAFIGYATNSKTYIFLNLESNMIVESRDVEFFQHYLLQEINFKFKFKLVEGQLRSNLLKLVINQVNLVKAKKSKNQKN
ncbi:hypothetical protein PanWU01x14_178580 [Parasponia andersonii]|uniref:Retroviral polymerase SH3-like domain-containing protein n=1 Tax=Parasponia andersonii TaxID=3476 RepID=A0A2P5C740_PARAD|nr:hypothetical protein PanWU01x14_178580 [Parasponia andersonii]